MISISHIGTYLSCYLNDHYTRDNEYLIGIPVDGRTTNAVIRSALEDEWNSCGPDWADQNDDMQFHDQVKQMFYYVPSDHPFDASLDTIDDDDEDMQDMCYAWFVITKS